jgi:hypothetical protein
MKHTFDIELNGESYKCRTTFAAIDAFEDKSGLSIAEAWGALAEGKMKFSTIATAIWAGINGERGFNGDKPLIWATVGQMVQEHGFLKCAAYASEFFAHSLPSGDDKKKEEGEQKKSSE